MDLNFRYKTDRLQSFLTLSTEAGIVGLDATCRNYCFTIDALITRRSKFFVFSGGYTFNSKDVALCGSKYLYTLQSLVASSVFVSVRNVTCTTASLKVAIDALFLIMPLII